MKKWLAFLMIVLVYCSACKKEGVDNSAYFIKATINGEEKTFSNNPLAAEYAGDITAGFSMSANNNADSSSFMLGIGHPFGVKIMAGTYNKIANGYYPTGTYINDITHYVSKILLPDSSTMQITISNLSATTVTGSFSGTLHNIDDSTAEVAITNGSFYLPLQQ